ncbi:winged helix-turn-helix domain-containing protein [Pseudoalteromonas sp. PPB1]|uniref:winged helix-turn-helix domain-containing protein n=1 Tax=Pseudoalteromonas sp. PPB1 TaxID=2756136 RepID=UPI00189168EE|nr:winged helix-turn-helix domain-containing protein [Pseudoalteromonas sp. PPB1]
MSIKKINDVTFFDLRNVQKNHIESGPFESGVYEVNDIIVDFSTNQLTDPYGRKTRLEPLIMELLAFMIKNTGSYLSCNDLMQHVWSGKIVSDNTIRVAMKKLRDAMGDNPKLPKFIKTTPSKGYILIAQVSKKEFNNNNILPISNKLIMSRVGKLFSNFFIR